MTDSKIKRINELYKKSKVVELTQNEKKEQEVLRKEYIDEIKFSLKAKLDNITIVDSKYT